MKKTFLIYFVFVLMLSIPVWAKAEGIKWQSYDHGLRRGVIENKKIFVNFYADWCTFCKKMEAESFSDSEIIKFIDRHFIPIRVDIDQERKIASSYFVKGLPTSWFLESDGLKIMNLPGYVNRDMFLKILKFIASDSYKKMTFKEYFESTK